MSYNPFTAYVNWLHLQWPAGRVEKLPATRDGGATNVPGVRVVGDLTGIPLLKFSADTGARAVQAILVEADFAGREQDKDVIDIGIIGGGVSGIAAAMEAAKAGLSYHVFEATQTFSTLVNFPKGKPIYTYPTEMVPAGDLQFHGQVKEALVEEVEAQRQKAGVEVTNARITHIERKGRELHLHHADDAKSVTRCHRVIVAIGRSGNFRKMGIPGEDLDKVTNRLHDPMDYAGKDVLVVGGGDSALETAIALGACGARVTLSYRKKEFSRPKPENIEKLEALARNPEAEVDVKSPSSERVSTAANSRMRHGAPAGWVKLELGSQPREIREGEVVLKTASGQETTLPNDAVFSMIGREAPLDFFRRSGIRIHGEGTPLGWIALGLFLIFCLWLYAWKGGAPNTEQLGAWPGEMPRFVSGWGDWWAAQVADRGTLIGTLAVSMKSRSFYYTLAYSLCVVIFGVARIRRRKTPYVTVQTSVLMAVQVIPLFLLPEVILPLLGYHGAFTQGFGKVLGDGLFESYIGGAPENVAANWLAWGHPRAYWRAYGFILAWPLMVYNVFTAAPMLWWLIICAIQTCVLIPVLIWFFGKGAYCGWICSCGALAETMGDTHRQKMPHGPVPNRLNFIGQAFLVVALGLLVLRIAGWIWPGTGIQQVFDFALEGKGADGKLSWASVFSYKWFIDVLFGGILGVGLYFKYSGRVWCRFACPLAALMHIYTRFSRFRIFADKKKCISCNVCTSVCHQGIDIMNFANKGLPMEDPQCVRCSACVQQCPTGVLSFGRYGSDGVPLLDKLAASPVRMREEKKSV